MIEETPVEPAVYDVIVDFGNGTFVKVETGLSSGAAKIARKRISKFFLGVQVVERPRKGRARTRNADASPE